MKVAIVLIAFVVVAVHADVNRAIDQQTQGGQGLGMQQGLDQQRQDQQQQRPQPKKYRRAIDKEGVKDTLNKGTDKLAETKENIKENVRRTRDIGTQGLGQQKQGFESGLGVDQGKVLGQQQGLDQQQQQRRPRQMQRIVDIRQPRQMQRIVDIRQPREYMFDEY